uniref:Piwi domain-containing protein n=1 Tax=Ascaris lumbricoides TaxID=6252 RepID=A0A0M3I8N9_ASCLU
MQSIYAMHGSLCRYSSRWPYHRKYVDQFHKLIATLLRKWSTSSHRSFCIVITYASNRDNRNTKTLLSVYY